MILVLVVDVFVVYLDKIDEKKMHSQNKHNPIIFLDTMCVCLCVYVWIYFDFQLNPITIHLSILYDEPGLFMLHNPNWFTKTTTWRCWFSSLSSNWNVFFFFIKAIEEVETKEEWNKKCPKDFVVHITRWSIYFHIWISNSLRFFFSLSDLIAFISHTVRENHWKEDHFSNDKFFSTANPEKKNCLRERRENNFT